MSPRNDTSTNATDCDHLLFSSTFSREFNATEQYGLCPDTYVSFGVSLVYLLVYLSVLLLNTMGLFWKRKSSHITARNSWQMFLTMIISSIVVVGISLRIIVGMYLLQLCNSFERQKDISLCPVFHFILCVTSFCGNANISEMFPNVLFVQA